MQKMILNTYTFWRNPDQFTIPKKQKFFATKAMYSGEAYFSWGLGIQGQRVSLEWEWMDSTMFTELQNILELDTSVTWDPQTGYTYTVQVLSLDGTYVTKSLLDATDWRQSVKLELMIVS